MTAAVDGLGSATAAAARVAELEGLIARVDEAPPQSGSFGAQLAAAVMPGQATAPAGGLDPSTPFAGQIEAAAARYGLDPALLAAMIRAESNFDPSAGSPAGAQGLTQLMPETARSLGVTDPYDPVQSIDGGARFLHEQLEAFGGDPELALAAYNAGPGAVQEYGGVPPYAETQAYVKRVLGYAAEYRRAATAVPGPGA